MCTRPLSKMTSNNFQISEVTETVCGLYLSEHIDLLFSMWPCPRVSCGLITTPLT